MSLGNAGRHPSTRTILTVPYSSIPMATPLLPVALGSGLTPLPAVAAGPAPASSWTSPALSPPVAAVAPVAPLAPVAAVAPVPGALVPQAGPAPADSPSPVPLAPAASWAPPATASALTDTAVTWITPASGSSVITDDKVQVSWKSLTHIANPSFKLCTSADSCGAPIWPDVTVGADGSNSVTLTPPKMDSDTPFYLIMRGDDMANRQSPGFTILSGTSSSTTITDWDPISDPTSQTPLIGSSPNPPGPDALGSSKLESSTSTSQSKGDSDPTSFNPDASSSTASSPDSPGASTSALTPGEGFQRGSTVFNNDPDLHEGPGPSIISVLSQARMATATPLDAQPTDGYALQTGVSPHPTGGFPRTGGVKTPGMLTTAAVKSTVNGTALALSLLAFAAISIGALMYFIRKKRRDKRNAIPVVAYTSSGGGDVEKGLGEPVRKVMLLKRDHDPYPDKFECLPLPSDPYEYAVPVLERNAPFTQYSREYVHPDAFEGARYFPFQTRSSKSGSRRDLRPPNPISRASTTSKPYYPSFRRTRPYTGDFPDELGEHYTQRPRRLLAVHPYYPRPVSEPSYPRSSRSSRSSSIASRDDRRPSSALSIGRNLTPKTHGADWSRPLPTMTPNVLSTPFLPKLQRVPYRSSMGVHRSPSLMSESSLASSCRSGRSRSIRGVLQREEFVNMYAEFGAAGREAERYNVRRGRVEDQSMRSLYKGLHQSLQMRS